MSVMRRVAAGAIVARSSTKLFERPDRLPRALLAMAPWGATLPGVVAGAAARYPDRAAVIDDEGTLTYKDGWRRVRALAAGLTAEGLAPRVRVGLLCRNHRGFVVSLAAVAATGADVVLLNTGFAGPQLAGVVVSERIDVVLHDTEFGSIVRGCGADRTFDEAAIAAMIAAGGRARPCRTQGAVVILTSGTTGRPKGAARSPDLASIEGVASVLGRVPLRLGDTQVIAAPLFHAWGLSNVLLGLSRCATTVLSRRFDPALTIRALTDTNADVLVVVPVMLARIVALPPTATTTTPGRSRLRVIASSGSAIGGKLAADVLDRFGPVLYNLYGSTEVAIATIATPADLRAAPTTAGRVASGVQVEILDDAGLPVAPGVSGRIFVGGAGRFAGYTNGDGKEQQRGLLSSGDVGHFEGELLFVDGREDDMIVSGGENVFPVEVEEVLSHHPDVVEVAVIGIPDAEFGQALAAFVVRRPRLPLVDVEDLRSYVRVHLARYKVPRRVEFVDELPRNATGKVLRSVLIAAAQVPTSAQTLVRAASEKRTSK